MNYRQQTAHMTFATDKRIELSCSLDILRLSFCAFTKALTRALSVCSHVHDECKTTRRSDIFQSTG
jgi:hypothetical protein